MSIGVIGQGFVGGSLTTVLSERGETVYIFDKAKKIAKGGISTFEYQNASVVPDTIEEFVRQCELKTDFSGVFFVCVPTPMYQDGSADTSIVESVLNGLCSLESKRPRIAVIKSTVPPGTTQTWNEKFNSKNLFVIFNPEFLTEANALNDMREQNRIILGGPRPYINQVKQIYQRSFPNVLIVKTGSTIAEMVKYVINCHLAVKVSFANEISQICESLDDKGFDIDYDKVIEYAKLDPRVGETHWSVPGPVQNHDGRYVRGFGGHCFPKDINALMHVARCVGVEPCVLSGAWKKNLEVRPSKDRDWELQIGRAVSFKKEE